MTLLFWRLLPFQPFASQSQKPSVRQNNGYSKFLVGFRAQIYISGEDEKRVSGWISAYPSFVLVKISGWIFLGLHTITFTNSTQLCRQTDDNPDRVWGVKQVRLVVSESHWLSMTSQTVIRDESNMFAVRRNGSQSGEFLLYTPQNFLKINNSGELSGIITPPF